MDILNLPTYTLKTKVCNGMTQIFDRCRKKYVKLTPEEWVRQNMIEYLINNKNYPDALIANEAIVSINGMKKRCDSVIYDKTGTPRVIVEYKAPKVNITQEVFDQIATYNFKLNVDYLIVSNGINHYCCKINSEKHTYDFLREIPDCEF